MCLCVCVEGELSRQQKSVKAAEHYGCNGPFLHWKGFKSSLMQCEEKCSADVLAGKSVLFSQWVRPSLPPLLNVQRSLSFFKHLASTKPFNKHVVLT